METAIFNCGCSITMDMFNNQILGAHHCLDHFHMYSENKTNKQMAQEIRTKITQNTKG